MIKIAHNMAILAQEEGVKKFIFTIFSKQAKT